MSVDKTLSERKNSYGDFENYASICDKFKTIAYDFANERMTHVHTEAMDMIFSKLARILNGDPDHIDSWHDIAGYATLVENWIKNEKELENISKIKSK